MSSYRAYKYPFVGMPAEPPVLKILPMTFEKGRLASAFYVSWNGATEVASWNFYAGRRELGALPKVGSAPKMGFETSWVMPELVQYAYAEAVDKKGTVLAKSATQNIGPPVNGTYQAASPLLRLAEAQDTTPLGFKLPLSTPAVVTDATQWLPALLFDGLALWGFYCMVRVFSKDFRWQKGYKSLA